MHKSLGNGVDPLDMIKKYGADLVRLLVASADYQVDVRASENIFKQLSDAYRKIRNTARFLLADLYDFEPDRDMLPMDELCEIDKWIVASMNELTRVVREAYDSFEFHTIYHEVNNFCTVELSKLYIDITKDRVYAEAADSKARRSAQTAMYFIISGLTRLLAPLLSFTAEEIWQAMPHRASDLCESVYLNDMPAFDEALTFSEVTERWNALFALRENVMKALELARAEKRIGKSLDAKVTVYAADEKTFALLDAHRDELPTVFIVSQVELVKGETPAEAVIEDSPIGVLVVEAEGEKCDRCWNYTVNGFKDGEDGCLCPRCRAVLGK
jgi:isoleucyl-tRNA synthetase